MNLPGIAARYGRVAGAPDNFLQPILTFMQMSLHIRVPLISSFILIYGVNCVRFIFRKEKLEKLLAKKGKKHQHVFLLAITFDRSQEGCAEVFTIFCLLSHLSTILISKIGALKQSRNRFNKLAHPQRPPERLFLHDEYMHGYVLI